MTNNLMTVGALQALAECDVDVPGQLTLASFGELNWTTLIRTPAHDRVPARVRAGHDGRSAARGRIADCQGPG